MTARVTLSTVDGAPSARLSFPTTHGAIVVGAVGSSRAGALHNAAMIAEQIASDPVLSALLPPGALPAIMAAKKLGQAAKAGLPALKALWSTLHGPGKKRLAAALASDASPDEHAEVGGFFESAAAAALNPAGFAAAQAAKLLKRKLKQRKAAKAKAQAARDRANRDQGYADGSRSMPREPSTPDDSNWPAEHGYDYAEPARESMPAASSWEAEQADNDDAAADLADLADATDNGAE